MCVYGGGHLKCLRESSSPTLQPQASPLLATGSQNGLTLPGNPPSSLPARLLLIILDGPLLQEASLAFHYRHSPLNCDFLSVFSCAENLSRADVVLTSSLSPQYNPSQGMTQSRTGAQGTSAGWTSPRKTVIMIDFHATEIMSFFILNEINPEYSLEELTVKLRSSNTLAT